MKKTSGHHWTSNDPYWQGRPPNKTVYFADGTFVFQSTPGFEHPLVNPADEPPDMRWRWAKGSCGRSGPPGAFLRASIDGREFPTMVVSRHAANWGWVMNNCWAVSTSFPLPPPGEDPDLEDDALPVTVSAQSEEAMCFNLGVPRLPETGSGAADRDVLSLLMHALQAPGALEEQDSEDEETEEDEGTYTETDEEDEEAAYTVLGSGGARSSEAERCNNGDTGGSSDATRGAGALSPTDSEAEGAKTPEDETHSRDGAETQEAGSHAAHQGGNHGSGPSTRPEAASGRVEDSLC